MRIGIAQIDTSPGALDQTVERMVTQSQRAAEQKVELLVFPLAALAGVEALPYADRVPFMRDVAQAVADLAQRLACPAIVPVPVDLGGPDGFFDTLLIDGGEVRPLRMASKLESDDRAEQRDADVPTFVFGDVRFALALTHEELDSLCDYDYNVDVVLFVSGYPFAMDDQSSVMGADLDSTRFVDDARDADAWLVGVASLGYYGDEVFTGSSFVLEPSGSLVTSAPAFEEALLVAEVGSSDVGLLETPVSPEVFDAPFHLWQSVVMGIHGFVEKNGFADVAVCLDGSLNASVLAALATDALGPLHVHVLIGASAGAGAAACRELARRLRVDQVSSSGTLYGLSERDADDLELLTLARRTNALVLAPYDKTALAINASSCRANGALLCPLGDIYRSDVLDMAHVRNTISPLFRRVAFGQADELTLVMGDGTVRTIVTEQDVTAIDEILLDYIEYDRPLAQQVAGARRDPDLVKSVQAAERAGEVYRRSLPPVLAMSTHTLDDARFPLGFDWDDLHEDESDGFMAPIVAQSDAVIPKKGEESAADALPEQHPALPTGVDLEATLAMLRDLAEQSGFNVADLVPLNGTDISAPMDEGPGEGAKLPGWMSPFSEN